MDFEGKVAFVTGSSRGIGKAIVLELAKLGCSVIIHYNSKKEEALKVKQQCDAIIRDHLGVGTRTSQQSFVVQADVGKSSDVARSLHEIKGFFPSGIDYLICSAGIIIYKPTLQVSETEMDAILATNVKGTILYNQGVFGGIEGFRENLIKPGGSIINISSSATAMNPISPLYSLYVASKGAVEQFSKAFAQEIGRPPYRVRLNVLSPGPTDTEMFTQGKSQDQIDRLAKMSVMERIGTSQEVATAIISFLKPEAAWIIGQNIRINGGTAS